MSPTLLEGVLALVIVVLGWYVGLGLAPLLWARWRQAKQQLEHIDHLATLDPAAAARKESNHEHATTDQQPPRAE